MIQLEPNRKERWSDVRYQTLRDVAQKIDQLDEPEVTLNRAFEKVSETYPMTTEGVCRHLEQVVAHGGKVTYGNQEVLSQEESINIVLHDLKEYIKEQQSLSHNTGLAHTSAGNDTHYRQYDYVLECIDEYEPSDELQNLIIPKQDLPVVPTWFDEWWKDVYKGDGNLLHNIAQFHDKLYSSETREMYNYINTPDNKKKLLNIIINELDYVVEDEQKYFVSSRESVGFWFLSKNNDNEVVIGTNKDYYDRKWESLKLTEEEIKDYDSRYWAFAVKVEEVEE